MFVSDAVILEDLRKVLKKPGTALPTSWVTIVELQHAAAFDQIRSLLIARGYLAADILRWASGPSVERAHSLYLCLCEGAGLEGYDDKFLRRLNRTAFLKTCLLFDKDTGEQILPTIGQAGTCSTGPMNTLGDRFVLDPEEPGLGEPTRS